MCSWFLSGIAWNSPIKFVLDQDLVDLVIQKQVAKKKTPKHSHTRRLRSLTLTLYSCCIYQQGPLGGLLIGFCVLTDLTVLREFNAHRTLFTFPSITQLAAASDGNVWMWKQLNMWFLNVCECIRMFLKSVAVFEWFHALFHCVLLFSHRQGELFAIPGFGLSGSILANCPGIQ